MLLFASLGVHALATALLPWCLALPPRIRGRIVSRLGLTPQYTRAVPQCRSDIASNTVATSRPDSSLAIRRTGDKVWRYNYKCPCPFPVTPGLLIRQVFKIYLLVPTTTPTPATRDVRGCPKSPHCMYASRITEAHTPLTASRSILRNPETRVPSPMMAAHRLRRVSPCSAVIPLADDWNQPPNQEVMSSLTSIASSVVAYHHENGRRYHALSRGS